MGGTAALEFRENTDLERDVKLKASFLDDFLNNEIKPMVEGIEIRGVGLIWGIDLTQCGGGSLAKQIASRCFELGLIIERVGRNDTVLKILPPLSIDMATLQKGCSQIKQAFKDCVV